jgi:hypothetical protein
MIGSQQHHVSQTTYDTIHFTARVLLAKQHRACRALKKFRIVNDSGSDIQVYWQRAENQRNSKGKGRAIENAQTLSIAESGVTDE